MPVKPVFRCEHCDGRPDADTQTSLEAQMLDMRHGEYVDAPPGNWLTWSGGGLYGKTLYACGDHRGDLKARLREDYGTLGWHPWAKGPHPWAGRRGSDRARRLRHTVKSGFVPPSG